MCLDEITLSAYIDGELTPQEEKTIETHIEICSACKKRLEEFLELQGSLQQLDFAVSSAQTAESWQSFQARLQKKTSLATKSGQSFWTRRVPMPIVSGIAALLVVMIGVTFSMAIQQQNNHSSGAQVVAVAEVSAAPSVGGEPSTVSSAPSVGAEPAAVASAEPVVTQATVATQTSPSATTGAEGVKGAEGAEGVKGEASPVTAVATEPSRVPEAKAELSEVQTVEVVAAPMAAPVVTPMATPVATPMAEASESEASADVSEPTAPTTRTVMRSNQSLAGQAPVSQILASQAPAEQYLFSPALTAEIEEAASVASETELTTMENHARMMHRSSMGMMHGKGGHGMMSSSATSSVSAEPSAVTLVEVIEYLESLDILYKLWIPQEEEMFRLIFSDGEQRLYTDIPETYVTNPSGNP